MLALLLSVRHSGHGCLADAWLRPPLPRHRRRHLIVVDIVVGATRQSLPPRRHRCRLVVADATAAITLSRLMSCHRHCRYRRCRVVAAYVALLPPPPRHCRHLVAIVTTLLPPTLSHNGCQVVSAVVTQSSVIAVAKRLSLPLAATVASSTLRQLLRRHSCSQCYYHYSRISAVVVAALLSPLPPLT